MDAKHEKMPEEYIEPNLGRVVGIYWHPQGGYFIVERGSLKDMLDDNREREQLGYRLVSKFYQNVNSEFFRKCCQIVKTLKHDKPKQIHLTDIINA